MISRDAQPVPLPTLVAPNSFKGTLTSAQAAQAIAAGVLHAWPGSEVMLKPMADGGDGFLDTLVAARGGRRTEHQVRGPLGAPVTASIGWLTGPAGESAVIELASTCGLTLVPSPGPASAGRAGTRGLGELLRLAMAHRPVSVLVGLGGSASTDGGAGAAQALGYRLLDRAGAEVGPGGLGLVELDRIEVAAAAPELRLVQLVAAYDVTNPLLGDDGAAAIYGPQKGADPLTVRELERGLRRLAAVADRDLGRSDAASFPGAGAAGGAGFGLVRFCGSELEPGVSLVARAVGLDQALDRCRVVFTGEGRFDLQSLEGKATGEVARRAAQRGLPCLVLAASADPEAVSRLQGLGGTFVPVDSESGPPKDRGQAAARLTGATARACRALLER